MDTLYIFYILIQEKDLSSFLKKPFSSFLPEHICAKTIQYIVQKTAVKFISESDKGRIILQIIMLPPALP